MKLAVVATLIANIVSFVTAWAINLIASLSGACESFGPAGAFVLPLLIVFAIATMLIVYPLMFGLRKILGAVASMLIVVSVFIAGMAALFYRPGVDFSYLRFFVKAVLS